MSDGENHMRSLEGVPCLGNSLRNMVRLGDHEANYYFTRLSREYEVPFSLKTQG